MIRNAKIGDRVAIDAYGKHGTVTDVILIQQREKLIKVQWDDKSTSAHEPGVLKREG